MNRLFRIFAKHRVYWCILFAFRFLNPENTLAIDTNEPDSLKILNETKEKIRAECKNLLVSDILTKANDYSFRDMPTALIYTDIAIEKARAMNNNDTLFDALRDVGFIYDDNGLYQEAVVAFQKTAELAESKPEIYQPIILNDLAIANRKAKNYRAAYSFYDKYLELAQKSGDRVQLAEVYHGLGGLYRESNIYDKAIDNYLKSLNYSLMDNDTVDIIISHNDLADAYLKAQNIDRAREHIEKSYVMAQARSINRSQNADARFRLASVQCSYGDILIALKDYDGALKKYEESYAVYKSLNYKIQIAHVLLRLAGLYRERRQFDKAEETFKECSAFETHFKAGVLLP